MAGSQHATANSSGEIQAMVETSKIKIIANQSHGHHHKVSDKDPTPRRDNPFKLCAFGGWIRLPIYRTPKAVIQPCGSDFGQYFRNLISSQDCKIPKVPSHFTS